MEAYHHYADYLIKRSMSDPGSIDVFLRYVLFAGSLWQSKVLGLEKDIKGLEGPGHREDLNKAIKQETLDGGLLFSNARIVIEGEDSIAVEDIYQLLRQEAAVLMPRERRMALIAVIISLSDSYIHRINQRPYAFLEITNILGPKTFIGFASINLYLIEAEFYERYFEGLGKEWRDAEVEKILNRSFSSLLFGYWIRRLWLERDKDKEAADRLEALKGLLDTIWSATVYASVFYEALVFFKQQLPDLVDYFDEGGIKMKSFVDTMPKAVREIYEEVLVKPVEKKYGEKLKQVELEKKLEVEHERAEHERAEREREHERAERERAEKELRSACLQAVVNKFPDISARTLLTINQLSFSQCNKLIIELGMIADVHSCELFLKKLS